jgi:hypothetical protein
VPVAGQLGCLALPASQAEAATLVVFCGDGTFDWILDAASVLPFSPANARPKAMVSGKSSMASHKELASAVKEALDRAAVLAISKEKASSKGKKKNHRK